MSDDQHRPDTADTASTINTYGTGGLPAGSSEELQEPVDALVLHLNVAITTSSIYPTTHPKAVAAVSELRATFRRYLHANNDRTSAPFTLLVVEDELAIDGKPWRRSKVLCSHLLEALERHAIQRINAPAGVDPGAIVDTFVALTGPEGPVPNDAIEVGKLELLEDGEGDPTAGQASLENRVDALHKQFDAFVQGRQPSYRPLADAMGAFVDAISTSHQKLLINPALRTQGDRLFRHSLGTAIGTYALALSLGVTGDVLRDIVTAALLHDIGIFDRAEFDQADHIVDIGDRARQHPAIGAARLALTDELPPLVFLVALQHHRTPNGGGFPATNARLNLASAIVAVADAWDVLFNLSGTMPTPIRWQFARTQLQTLGRTDLQPELVTLFLEIVSAQE